MAFKASQLSESSSSGEEEEETDSTGAPSTTSCTSTQLTRANDAVTLNGIGTINMVNCQESHIGTRIVADNLNIILNNPKDFGLVEQIVKPLTLPYFENLDWERKIEDNRFGRNIVTDENLDNPSFSWAYKKRKNPFSYNCSCSKRTLILFLGILLLIIMVVTMVILFGRKSTRKFPGGNTASTVSPTSSMITAETLPTYDGRTTTYEPTPRPVVGEFISRSSWGGRQPPAAALRNNLRITEFLALDNLQGERCSSVGNCSAILQQLEKAEDGSLNYNFLIDDVGNLYEARGWDYMSDYTSTAASPLTTVKVAFIGNYTDSHLTTEQISSFQQKIHLNYTEVLSITSVEAQCCRNVANETGPDQNVICDMENTIRYVKSKYCSPCRWNPGQLNCK